MGLFDDLKNKAEMLVKAAVDGEIQKQVDKVEDAASDKLKNIAYTEAEKKFLLSIEKSYKEYGYEVCLDENNDGHLSNEELNVAVSKITTFIDSNRDMVASSMMSKGYTVEEANNLLDKTKEVLRNIDNARIVDESGKEEAFSKAYKAMEEYGNLALALYNKYNNPNVNTNNGENNYNNQ